MSTSPMHDRFGSVGRRPAPPHDDDKAMDLRMNRALAATTIGISGSSSTDFSFLDSPRASSSTLEFPSATSTVTMHNNDSSFDVMAQLASQYYSFGRNRSRSAPVPPAAMVGATWQYSDDESPNLTATPVQPPLPPSLNLLSTGDMGAIGSQLNGAGHVGGDLPSLHLTEPENEPSDGSDKSSALLPATFLRTICDQLEFYFCDENLLGDLFLLKNMNAEGYGTFR
jgi:hypothetical protein